MLNTTKMTTGLEKNHDLNFFKSHFLFKYDFLFKSDFLLFLCKHVIQGDNKGYKCYMIM